METHADGGISILVQSAMRPEWGRLPAGMCSAGPECKPLDAFLSGVRNGGVFRFRLLANPTKKIGTKTGPDGKKNNGKRVELRGEDAWLGWLERKAPGCGFRLLRVSVSAHSPTASASWQGKTTGHRRGLDGERAALTFGGVLFDGVFEVLDCGLLMKSVASGIGPGKAFGFGLLSIAPAKEE